MTGRHIYMTGGVNRLPARVGSAFAAGDPALRSAWFRPAKVFLASYPVDFRKRPDGLMALVRDAGAHPFNGVLYVFRAKRGE